MPVSQSAGCNLANYPSITRNEMTTATKAVRLPKMVRYWAEQFIKEGESIRAAHYHAIQRAFESGDISEATADRLEALLLGTPS